MLHFITFGNGVVYECPVGRILVEYVLIVGLPKEKSQMRTICFIIITDEDTWGWGNIVMERYIGKWRDIEI